MTENKFPVRMNTKAAKNPNKDVYVNWNSERNTAINSGVRGLVRRNSYRWWRCAMPKYSGVKKTISFVEKSARIWRGTIKARQMTSSVTGPCIAQHAARRKLREHGRTAT